MQATRADGRPAMILAAKVVLLGACCGGAGAFFVNSLQASQDPIERYTVLGILMAVLAGGFKVLLSIKDAIAAMAMSNQALNTTMQTAMQQNQEAHRTYAVERDRAVGVVKEHIANVKDHVDSRHAVVIEAINRLGGLT